jgi:hypothetical protein
MHSTVKEHFNRARGRTFPFNDPANRRSGTAGWKSGDVWYGFSGREGPTILLVRWNEQEIEFEQGRLLDPKAVITAFSQPATK